MPSGFIPVTSFTSKKYGLMSSTKKSRNRRSPAAASGSPFETAVDAVDTDDETLSQSSTSQRAATFSLTEKNAMYRLALQDRFYKALKGPRSGLQFNTAVKSLFSKLLFTFSCYYIMRTFVYICVIDMCITHANLHVRTVCILLFTTTAFVRTNSELICAM